MKKVTHMSKRLLTCAALALSLLAVAPVRADSPKPAAGTTCPEVVKGAIAHLFPKATIARCKPEHEDGHDQFEVKVVKADGAKAEVDVAPDGKVLQIEEKVAVDSLPAAVKKAFATKYPKAKLLGAEKQTPAAGTPSYELAFHTDHGRVEATFAEDGTFVEEE